MDPPKHIQDYIRYFCSDESANSEQIKAKEQKRIKLYKLTAALVRAYANLANEMAAAGYSTAEAEKIKKEVGDYEYVRQQVKLASGDYIDLKMYEPDMRHLLDTYIQAEESETISTFDNIPLVQLIVNKGADKAIENCQKAVRTSEEAIAATIENNIRRVIVDKSEINPKYYEDMSRLLDELIRQQRQDAINYRNTYPEVTRLSKRVTDSTADSNYPPNIDTGPSAGFFLIIYQMICQLIVELRWQ